MNPEKRLPSEKNVLGFFPEEALRSGTELEKFLLEEVQNRKDAPSAQEESTTEVQEVDSGAHARNPNFFGFGNMGVARAPFDHDDSREDGVYVQHRRNPVFKPEANEIPKDEYGRMHPLIAGTMVEGWEHQYRLVDYNRNEIGKNIHIVRAEDRFFAGENAEVDLGRGINIAPSNVIRLFDELGWKENLAVSESLQKAFPNAFDAHQNERVVYSGRLQRGEHSQGFLLSGEEIMDAGSRRRNIQDRGSGRV